MDVLTKYGEHPILEIPGRGHTFGYVQKVSKKRLKLFLTAMCF